MRLTARQRRALRLMGIECWERRAGARPPADQRGPGSAAPPPASAHDAVPAALDWPALEQAVAGCRRCELHCSRTQTVFGTGDVQADWMFVGEAPGAEEDRQGEPFVGRAGQLLNAMLLAAGRERSGVYIANILKCRPPRNRDPSDEEAARCAPWLARQIELVAPRVLVALGRIAAQRLLQTDAPLGRLRGRVHEFRPTGAEGPALPLVVTYHPAYLLRSPKEKRRAWEDLRLIMQVSE